MESKIVSIGNSKGVILPSQLLKSLNISTLDKVSISQKKGSIVIKAIESPRNQWEKLIKEELKKGAIEKLTLEVFDEESFDKQWTW